MYVYGVCYCMGWHVMTGWGTDAYCTASHCRATLTLLTLAQSQKEEHAARMYMEEFVPFYCTLTAVNSSRNVNVSTESERGACSKD